MMMRILGLLIVLTATPAWAEMPGNGRYQLLAVSGGFVRLDTVTGAMTYCRDEVDGFGCTEMVAGQAPAEAKPRSEKSSERDSSAENQDFEKALSMAEKALRSFMAIAKEHQSEECTL